MSRLRFPAIDVCAPECHCIAYRHDGVHLDIGLGCGLFRRPTRRLLASAPLVVAELSPLDRLLDWRGRNYGNEVLPIAMSRLVQIGISYFSQRSEGGHP